MEVPEKKNTGGVLRARSAARGGRAPGVAALSLPTNPEGWGGVFGALQATPRDLQLQGGRAGRSQANIPGLAESLGGPRESSPSQRDLQCVELGPAACHLCDPWAVKKKMFITVLFIKAKKLETIQKSIS